MPPLIHLFALNLLLGAGLVSAAEITLSGLMPGRAMLTVNGASRIYTVGQAIGGSHRLLEIGSDHVILEAAGRKQRVGVGQRATGNTPGEESATLYRDARGHFSGPGSINDRPVRFLVDTGATRIAMGIGHARRLGLDKLAGQRGAAQTANGIIETTCVRLDRVTLGEISLDGVHACYSDKDMPEILLGMSFLERTEMKINGEQLRLKKRF